MSTQTITFTERSAVALIRAARLDDGLSLAETDLTRVPKPGRWDFGAADIASAFPGAFPPPDATHWLHVLVPAERMQRRGIQCHRSAGLYPPGSFLEVSRSDSSTGSLPPGVRVYVSAPPLCLMSCARMVRARASRLGSAGDGALVVFLEVAAVALELCGRYGRHPLSPRDGTCLDNLDPITTVQELAAYFEAAGDGDDSRLVRRTIPYLADGLRSPLESAVHLSLDLPPRYGGLSFPPHECNQPLELPEGYRGPRDFGFGHILPDFLWRAQRVAIETEGYATHGTREGRLSDNRRQHFYNACDVTVFPVLYDEVLTRARLDDVLRRVAVCLAKDDAVLARRLKRNFADKAAASRRAVLLHRLLPPVRPEEDGERRG